MVNFPTTIVPITGTTTSRKGSARRVASSTAAENRETHSIDRRTRRDRRSRRGQKQIMDRRSGPERRRSTIDFSV